MLVATIYCIGGVLLPDWIKANLGCRFNGYLGLRIILGIRMNGAEWDEMCRPRCYGEAYVFPTPVALRGGPRRRVRIVLKVDSL